MKRSEKPQQVTTITIGALVVAEPEDECAAKLTTYATGVQRISPADISTRFEVGGVEQVDPVRCAGAVRFTIEFREGRESGKTTSSSAKRPFDPNWLVDAFEEQLGSGERVLYACDKRTLRLG